MARRLSLLFSSAVVFALIACGGASDPGLFSASGASGGKPGGSAGADTAGMSARAGDGSTPPHQGGASSEGGNVGVAGQAAGGSNATGGSSAGSEAGGTAGTVSHAGAGGISAGSGGSAGGAGGSLGGSAGSSSGGGGTDPTCKELLAQAATQLEAASACDLARNATQCTGKVKTTCNCDTPVEDEGSPETQAYQATLKQIDQKKCVTICPAIACIAVNHGQCVANSASSTAGTCVSSFAVTPF